MSANAGSSPRVPPSLSHNYKGFHVPLPRKNRYKLQDNVMIPKEGPHHLGDQRRGDQLLSRI